MDPLNVKLLFSFLPPLFCGSSPPFSVTDAADPLGFSRPHLSFVKRMAVLAMRFLTIDVPQRGRIPKGVFTGSESVEMLRVDAIAVTADVIDNKTGRHTSVHSEIGYAMCSTVSASKMEGPVAVFVQRAVPQPALTDNLVLAFEPSKFGFSKMGHAQSLAHGAKGTKGYLQ